MKYIKICEDAYNLHIIKTNKFKMNMIRICFKNKYTKEDIAKRRLIPNVLFNSNKKYPSSRLMNIKKEELYNLNFGGTVTPSGMSIISTFQASFISDKYAPSLLNNAIEFISDILFNPQVSNKGFNESVFKMSKELLKEEIAVYNEEPNSCAMESVLAKMCPNTPIAYPLYGTIDEVNKISNKDLYNTYNDMINNDKVDIFIVGNVDDTVISKIKDRFNVLKNKREKTEHYIAHTEFKNKYVTYKEVKPYNQSTLILGYKVEDLTDFERFYVMPIYTYILGGGPDSKLFKNVREKNSLCYSISARFRNISNIILITSGINASSYNKATKLIKEEVENMRLGNFTKTDIDKAKTVYLSVYDELFDSIGGVMDVYHNKEYLNIDLPSIKKRKIRKVTKKDIISLSNKIHPEIVYLLEGSISNEENISK